MPDTAQNISGNGNAAQHRHRRFIVVGILLAIFPFLLVKIVLHSPMAAPALSSFATNYLHEKVTIAGVSLTGTTLTLHGLTVAAPTRFSIKHPLSAVSVAITPDLTALATGTKKLARLDVTGLTLHLERTPSGSWNLHNLLTQLRSRKKQQTEFQIGRLALHDTNVRFNGLHVFNLNLTGRDIATKGSKVTHLELSGEDPAGNPISLVAAGRLGSRLSGKGTLSAPALALGHLTPVLGGSHRFDLRNAVANLSLTVTAETALLRMNGTCGIDRLALTTGSGQLPLKANLQLAGQFGTDNHRATLEHARLSLNDRIRLTAAATADTGNKDGAFSLTIAPGTINLADLRSVLPKTLERQLVLAGTLTWPTAHLQGRRTTGITAGTGSVHLREGTIAARGVPLLVGGTADGTITGSGQGWQIDGHLASNDTTGKTLLEALDLPVHIRLGRHLQLSRLTIPTFTARLLGAPLSGKLDLNPAETQPFKASCTLAETNLTSANRFFAASSPLTFTGGTGRADLQFQGSSLNAINGTIHMTFNAIAALINKKPAMVRQASLHGSLLRKGGSTSAQGTMEAIDGRYAGTAYGANGQFTVSNRRITLHKLHVQSDKTFIALGGLSLGLPESTSGNGNGPSPLKLTFEHGAITHGKLAVSGINGTASGFASKGGTDRTLTGRGIFSVDAISVNGQSAASLSGTINATGTKAEMALVGTSLGGTLHATITGAPFASDPTVSWSAALEGQRLDHLARVLSTVSGPHFSSGTVTIKSAGHFNTTKGLSGTLSTDGSGLAISRGGKTLLSDISVHAEGTAQEGTLSLNTGTITHQQGTKLVLRGSIARFAARDRAGSISISMPATPVNGLIDTFVALLPPKLQEAVGSGSGAITSTLNIANGTATLSGIVDFSNAGLELPPQKLSIADLSGQLPFSVVYPWRPSDLVAPAASFTRDRFTQLRTALNQTNHSGTGLTLAHIRYGTMDMGPIHLTASAEQGIVHLNSFTANLYGGALRGTGQVLLKPGTTFGINLLLDNLSLARLCDAFPAIRGYISGRVDGMISLLGGRNNEGLTGYAQLWTRSGNGERMLVSKEFLQKLSGKKLRGFLLSNDRAYDTGEVVVYLRKGFLTFEKLDISHTTLLGVKDLRVSVVPVQNRISLDHLLESIREAAARGKSTGGEPAPVQTDLQWLE